MTVDGILPHLLAILPEYEKAVADAVAHGTGILHIPDHGEAKHIPYHEMHIVKKEDLDK